MQETSASFLLPDIQAEEERGEEEEEEERHADKLCLVI